MKEPRWLLREAVVAVHKIMIAEHGGSDVLRDDGLLESALSRPRHRFAYEKGATLFDLAAAYAYGLARNHPFVDGNKRVAITAVAMFLGDNGYRFAPDELDALKIVLRLATGEVEEKELAAWIKASATAKRPERRRRVRSSRPGKDTGRSPR